MTRIMMAKSMEDGSYVMTSASLDQALAKQDEAGGVDVNVVFFLKSLPGGHGALKNPTTPSPQKRRPNAKDSRGKNLQENGNNKMNDANRQDGDAESPDHRRRNKRMRG